MERILPCPCCGETDDIVCDYYTASPKNTYCYVQCNSCLYIVKTLGSEEEAIEEWNLKSIMRDSK